MQYFTDQILKDASVQICTRRSSLQRTLQTLMPSRTMTQIFQVLIALAVGSTLETDVKSEFVGRAETHMTEVEAVVGH